MNYLIGNVHYSIYNAVKEKRDLDFCSFVMLLLTSREFI